MADIAGEGFVERFGFRFEEPGFDLNSGGAQAFEPTSRNLRVGVSHAGYNPADASGDEGVHARSGAALVRTGFEVKVQSCPA